MQALGGEGAFQRLRDAGWRRRPGRTPREPSPQSSTKAAGGRLGVGPGEDLAGIADRLGGLGQRRLQPLQQRRRGRAGSAAASPRPRAPGRPGRPATALRGTDRRRRRRSARAQASASSAAPTRCSWAAAASVGSAARAASASSASARAVWASTLRMARGLALGPGRGGQLLGLLGGEEALVGAARLRRPRRRRTRCRR